MENGPETSTGLLRAMAAGADCARWTEFARLYTPLLKKWIAGIRAGHPHVPAYLEDDIVQETLITLMKQFPDFKYDRAKGAFRGYLHGIVRIKVLKACDAYRLTKRGRVDFDTEKAEMEGGKAVADGDPVADRLAIERALWEVLVARVFAGGAFSGTKITHQCHVLVVEGPGYAHPVTGGVQVLDHRVSQWVLGELHPRLGLQRLSDHL